TGAPKGLNHERSRLCFRRQPQFRADRQRVSRSCDFLKLPTAFARRCVCSRRGGSGGIPWKRRGAGLGRSINNNKSNELRRYTHMLRKIFVGDNERDLVIRKRRFETILGPGEYWLFTLGLELIRLNINPQVFVN